MNQYEWHMIKRRQGWKCKLDRDDYLGPALHLRPPHAGPCPLVPVWYRHPIWYWRTR